MTEKHTLPELIEQASGKHNGASGRRLADIAAEAGFDVSHTTLNRIRSGTYQGVPTPTTIKAIAWLAGITDEEAFAAAGQGVPGAPFASVLPPGVDNLGPSERRAVVELLRVFTQYHQRDWDRSQREWARIRDLTANVAASLRAGADLHEWAKEQLPDGQQDELDRLMLAVAQPLLHIATWWGEHAQTLAKERNASIAARSEIDEMFNAVAAVQHLHRGERDDLETTTQPDASAEGQQGQEAGADDAGEEAVRTSGPEPPPGSHEPSAARTARAFRRKAAKKVGD
ncbi:hypothetical protein BTO20_05765 [Mycobacterium dioxanotrophicus]|uniref:Uncharacterized protein n=1 Tax=Mycobacterium dioxanotrophicus TaxID=482462 RepID=A0A1Y0BZ06_9MYCO|nr:hypothetical protein [Mycobacterium dioxanotrophicus]ART68160.1 hypothetical protein BTO20_05765 [Mycobacterium dioxanotrophicus]